MVQKNNHHSFEKLVYDFSASPDIHFDIKSLQTVELN
jgi:hypothetical protein